MKKHFLKVGLASIFLYSASLTGASVDVINKEYRTKENIDLGWKFSKIKNGTKPIEINFDDSNWQSVTLPHNPDPASLLLDSVKETWEQKVWARDHDWYRKKMKISLNSDEKAYLLFEGVHNQTSLWINGKKVGKFDINGYVPFDFDITKFINSGSENTIVVDADNSNDPTIAPGPFKTDYIKWGGIYRDVYLVKKNKLHVNFNWENEDAGVTITTPTVEDINGTVSVKTTVVNDYNKKVNCKIITSIVDADGYVLKKLIKSAKINAGHQNIFRQTTDIVDNYNLWSPDHPYLYRAVSVIYMNGKPVDKVENNFGFRSIKLVDGQGLLLNGKPFFMLGVNRHQNFPYIGDAVPNSMHYEEALRFKKAGINAIRLSHYPQDDAFIDACDKLGILIYEEPSTWISWTPGVWMNKLITSARIMVRNHRNHPSIIIWGAGVNHRGVVPMLNSAIKEEDPTRLTASQSAPWGGRNNSGVSDIYATMDYRRSHWPEKDFCIAMEHGFSDDGRAMQFHISRYKKRKNNIGTFLWVGSDYNRFKEKVDNYDRVSNYGLQTIFRTPRPSYFWYKSETAKTAFVHIANESIYKKDKVVVFGNDPKHIGMEDLYRDKVMVYSNAPEVALYANDKLVAVQRCDNDPLRMLNEHESFTFPFHWTNQKLTAKAIFNGKVCATFTRYKTQEPYKLKVAVDDPDTKLIAGGSDLKMVRAYIVDKNGEVVTDATNNVHFEVSGAGSIMYKEKKYISNSAPKLGIATVYLKGGDKAGKITIKATSKHLKSGKLVLNSLPYNNDALALNKPIYDYLNCRFDINGVNNYLEHEWQNAFISDTKNCEIRIDKNISCKITANNELKLQKGSPSNPPTMLGNLCYLASDGLHVDSGTIVMTFKGLKKGVYKLTTYHHALVSTKKFFPYDLQVSRKDADGEVEFVSNDMICMYQEDPKDIGERDPMFVINRINSNGVDDVVIKFRVNKPKGSTWLNGFKLRRLK